MPMTSDQFSEVFARDRASLRAELASANSDSLGHTSIVVGSDVWYLSIFGVIRIANDVFVQVVLRGPRFCTATFRTPAVKSLGVTARQLLEVVGTWLASGDRRDHVYLECADIVDPPS
jgi:hypothetical protein